MSEDAARFEIDLFVVECRVGESCVRAVGVSCTVLVGYITEAAKGKKSAYVKGAELAIYHADDARCRKIKILAACHPYFARPLRQATP